MPVKAIRIIKQGTLSWEAFEEPETHVMAMKRLSGLGGGSTVTYIESDVKILVDTGFDYESDRSADNIKRNKKNLVHALKDMGLKPSDIDIVFITHWHYDHFGSLGAFKKSRILASQPLEGYKVATVKDGEAIADGVHVMYTPGHTQEHTSLLLKTEKLRYTMRNERGGGSIMGIGHVEVAVAGDAIIAPSYYMMDRLWDRNPNFYSSEKAMESVRKLEESADYIIPGHGNIFKNVKKVSS
jgi:glyoxylase-like metal-dependent hydrolase (beta-lactamase superfamily II)